ncbi:DNA recombination protein RmuC [soil metagenome]
MIDSGLSLANWLLLAGLAVVAVLQLVVLMRLRADGQADRLELRLAAIDAGQQRVEHELRTAVTESARGQRTELNATLAHHQQTLAQQLGGFSEALSRFADQQHGRFRELSDGNERRLGEIRATLEQKIGALQVENSAKLDEMRATVDEKLHATLEQRLGESFKIVSERLEAVHRGLGEMQGLAQGVGDLKRVLSNVKSRGVFGEVQLAALLEDLMTPEHLARNVATRPGSREFVEFAIKLPGDGETPVHLPIDAKFPIEDYERLVAAHDVADVIAVEQHGKALEQRLRLEARKIADKYIEPPHTTDFAILFLPTEGLYAEVLRRPGLFDELQRKHRIVIAGPTTLTALLSALRMGFRTLAIEKRSSEVWNVLSQVKNEFGKFGDVLATSKRQLQTVLNTMDSAEVRTRAIERQLKEVETLPAPEASDLEIGRLPGI